MREKIECDSRKASALEALKWSERLNKILSNPSLSEMEEETAKILFSPSFQKHVSRWKQKYGSEIFENFLKSIDADIYNNTNKRKKSVKNAMERQNKEKIMLQGEKHSIEVLDSTGTSWIEEDHEDEEIRLLACIQKNNSYDDYRKLVDIAYDLNDLEKIRQSIELFSAAYPLSPDIWLRYLKVEGLGDRSREQISKIISLFKRALADYYSIDVALELAALAKICFRGQAKEIWDILMPAYGYEFSKGRLIWAAWRADFMKREPYSHEKYEKVAKSFTQELQIPLNDMETTYQEFCEFVNEHKNKLANFDSSSTEITFKRTLKILKKVLPFEMKLKRLEPNEHQEQVDTYLSYIGDLYNDLEENGIHILYERMITACCCVNEIVWNEYLDFIRYRTTVYPKTSHIFHETELDIINRGLNYCPWSAFLNVHKLRILDANVMSREKIQKILEEAFKSKNSSAEPFTEMWIVLLSYHAKITDFRDRKKVEILMSNFDRAIKNLSFQNQNGSEVE